MTMKLKHVLSLAFIIVLLLSLGGCFSKTEETVKKDSQEFQPAIPIELKDLEGNTVSLESFKGKYILINFWATWCTYCDQEMSDLVALQKANEDLVVLAVSVKEDQKTIESYIKEKNINLKVLLDSKGEVAEAYGVNSMPTSYFIDRNGKVIGFLKGMMTAEDMEKAMTYLREKDTAK